MQGKNEKRKKKEDKMRYWTDLALETAENLKKDGVSPGENDGIVMDKNQVDENINVTEIKIENENGKRILGKPCGTYITIEVKNLVEAGEKEREKISRVIARELGKMVKHHYYFKALVAGLGNIKVTPDALGPETVSKIQATRHLFEIYECDGDEEYGNVAVIAPGVKGTTGLETLEVLQSLVKLVEPEVVIIVDALAAGTIDRVSTTIQLCDTGIAPGAGMGNHRKTINEDTLGVKVISIGVPTVIDTRNLLEEAFEKMNIDEGERDKYFKKRNFDMVVTTTNIDILTEYFSSILAKGINITLHPGIYS